MPTPVTKFEFILFYLYLLLKAGLLIPGADLTSLLSAGQKAKERSRETRELFSPDLGVVKSLQHRVHVVLIPHTEEEKNIKTNNE